VAQPPSHMTLIFRAPTVAAIPGHKKRLMFWEGNHTVVPAEAIRHSVDLVNKYTA